MFAGLAFGGEMSMTVGKNHTINPILSGLASLIKKFSMYPSGHPSVDSALSHQKMLFDNYDALKMTRTMGEIKEFAISFLDDTILVHDRGRVLRGLAICLNLNDIAFEGLKNGIYNLRNNDDFLVLREMKGNNIHIFILVADNYKTIKTGMRYIRESRKPKTISWFSLDMKRFIVFGGK